MSCYNFEDYTFTDGLLDVDATYVIHLTGNGRYDSVLKSLKEYNISNRIHILMNQGYKKCHKPAVDKPPLDLIDSFLTVFKHAKENGYENILVLEDDFIFDEKIKYQYHRDNVNTFIKKHTEAMIYYLGTIPFTVIPYNFTTYRCLHTCGSHSVIYNKSMIEKILNSNPKYDFDDFLNVTHPRYMYYTPLCYQLFPSTENSKYWGHSISFYNKIMVKLLRFVFYILMLDKQIQPGYIFFYLFSKVWILVLLLIIIKIK